MPDEINLILNDRTSGSLALLNRLITALEHELQQSEVSAEAFRKLVIRIRGKLTHFAAIENFLATLITHSGQRKNFPGEALHFIAAYRLYWEDSAGKITDNFLQQCAPKGLTILTHSHSETIHSLLNQLHAKELPFRVLQTLSAPGEEGKISYERMCEQQLQAELIEDENIRESLASVDLILVGCDALLADKFLNKVGTRAILEQAKQWNKPSCLVTESRKEITNPDWKNKLTKHPLFEWVPLNLMEWVVTETKLPQAAR